MPMLFFFFLSNLNFDCCLINEKLFLGASGGNKMKKKKKNPVDPLNIQINKMQNTQH